MLTKIKDQFLVLSGVGKLLGQAVRIAPASLVESAVGKEKQANFERNRAAVS